MTGSFKSTQRCPGEDDTPHRDAQVDPPRVTIYTIGHSNHELEAFIAILRSHDVGLVVDVRSSPYSRYVPQANRETLSRALLEAGITYRWLGDRLGGMPDGTVADYDLLRSSAGFRQGILDLLALARERRMSIMCSEGDHRACHRHRLITPALLDEGARILHIQPDGTLIDEDLEPRQLALF